jgi:hypothetical protein
VLVAQGEFSYNCFFAKVASPFPIANIAMPNSNCEISVAKKDTDTRARCSPTFSL